MKILGLIFRYLSKIRFRVLNLATIKDIPTEQFHAIIDELVAQGWEKRSTYNGFDAWIDYGKVKLKKQNTKLTFEWDNWTEGSVEGPISTITALAKEKNLKVTNEWRWSEYDENRKQPTRQ